PASARPTGTAATVTKPTGTATDPVESTVTAADCESSGTAADGTATDSPEFDLDALLQVRPDRIKWNVCVLVDAIALKRGYATASETCEIPGFGPVDVDWVSRILPESMVDVLVHDLVDIQAHATLTRHRRKALDQALKARDRRCVVAGCRRKRMLQADHRHDFAKHGPTSAANLEMLCEVHHREKTHRGARIERVGDEWHWYPPPPAPGEPQPPPGSIPWRSPVGEHLTAFDLDDLPEPDDPEPDGTLPFG
ncbi:MAG: HNH endonuclease signature motif containing protein, partial [Acidimicrobiales bacterium]